MNNEIFLEQKNFLGDPYNSVEMGHRTCNQWLKHLNLHTCLWLDLFKACQAQHKLKFNSIQVNFNSRWGNNPNFSSQPATQPKKKLPKLNFNSISTPIEALLVLISISPSTHSTAQKRKAYLETTPSYFITTLRPLQNFFKSSRC